MNPPDRRGHIPGPGGASGLTLSGVQFSREQTLTAAVFAGGDQLLTTTPPEQPSPLYCIIEGLTEA